MDKIYVAKNYIEIGKMLGLSTDKVMKNKVKVDLIIAINKIIKKKRWTKVEVAKKSKVKIKVITNIINRDITEVSVDELISVASELGLKVHLKVA